MSWGVTRYEGCPVPDTDHDGVNDEEDKCKDISGLRENAGCPVVKEELTQQMEEAAKLIFFRTGSHQLLSTSFASLDRIAQLLKEHRNSKWTLKAIPITRVPKPLISSSVNSRLKRCLLT